jgi:nucleoside-diphosphate-sugar epimerase
MIFVTGGSGLVGSHLLFDLVSSGKQVRALKRKNSSIELTKKIFGYYSNDTEKLLNFIEWIEGDVMDIYSLYDAMQDIDQVYHAAAMVSFHPSDQKEMMKINVDGTANVVNACLYKNVKKICYVSSIATLGRTDNDELVNEETQWKNSKNNSQYSISKYGAEREVWRGTIEGLPAVIVNPSVIIGPGDWKKGSSQLFQKLWDGLKFYTDGVNGYIDVRDVSKAMILLMESDIANSRFILSSENLDYLELFTMISEGLNKKIPSIKANYLLSQFAWRAEKLRSSITGKKPLITKETARTAFHKYYYSNEKIKKALNFEFIPMPQSISDTSKLFLKDISSR